jgi:1,4-alpha-glucan branching enzyme
MKSRFLEYTEMRKKAAVHDAERHEAEHDDRLALMATEYAEYYEYVADRFSNHYNSDLLGAIASLASRGMIELLATAATHAYLPLLPADRVRVQMKLGCEACERHFGVKPTGAWLPECGYRPGVIERVLTECGIDYFVVDTHAIAGGEVREAYGAEAKCSGGAPAGYGLSPSMATLRPYTLSGSAVSVFARDEVTAAQVWSRETGYPGDGNYREFHRRDSVSGLQYWRVTSKLLDLGQKQLYDPVAADETAREHARHFVELVAARLARYREACGEKGVLVAPYDMELFGHWWHEGTVWLKHVLNLLTSDERVALTTPGAYLASHRPSAEISIAECSWGHGGRHSTWANAETAWMWDSLARAETLHRSLSQKRSTLRGTLLSMADQAGRELILLEASDWPFLVTTRQAKEYAEERFLRHLGDYETLAGAALGGVDGDAAMAVLNSSAMRDSLFAWVDSEKL